MAFGVSVSAALRGLNENFGSFLVLDGGGVACCVEDVVGGDFGTG